MAALVKAAIDFTTGWVRVRFPYNPITVEIVKAIPGATWTPAQKAWLVPIEGWAVLSKQVKYEVEGVLKRPTNFTQVPIDGARPYQLEGAMFLAERSGGLLTLAPRLGKTRTALMAAQSTIAIGIADAVLVVYPNNVRYEWDSQVQRWWPGMILNTILAPGQRDAAYDAYLKGLSLAPGPFVIGVHYEILHREDIAREIYDLLVNRRYIMIADEIHYAKNRKAPRTHHLLGLAERAVARWALSGTPMRNRNRDLFSVFNFATPQSCGKGYWKWAQRYADAHQNEAGHWEDGGNSNDEELRDRLAAVSFRKTREEVAAWLPKSDRSVVTCEGDPKDMKRYRALEASLGAKIRAAIADADPTADQRSALEALAKITAKAKAPAAIDRAFHYAENGVKPIIFCHHHETLRQVEQAYNNVTIADPNYDGPNLYVAAGYVPPDERKKQIDAWKAAPQDAILLANTMSVNTGIDLSEAGVGIFVEYEWVPSDFRQAEDRLVDVHQGKALTGRIYEYLTVKGTIDEDMTTALLTKIRQIETIVGSEADMGQLAGALRAGGAAGVNAPLASTDKETVMSALRAIRDRWLSDDGGKNENDALAAEAAGLDDDEWGLGDTKEEIPF